MSHNKHHLPHSSSIQHIDYNDKDSELEICFSSGHTHKFPDCPKEHYDGLKNAESPGAYFHTNIRRKFKSNSAS